MRIILIVSGLVVMNLCAKNSLAQAPQADSLTQAMSSENALKLYHKAVIPSTALYNGRQYQDYSRTIKDGHPYFEATELSNGSFLYDNIVYENMPIIYDLVKGVVVMKDANNIFLMQLINEKVGWFKVLGHTFIRLEEDSTNRDIIRTGFYDVLYDGRITLLKKESKNIQENTSVQEGLVKYILSSRSYYIKKDGIYYSANSQGSILNVLKDKKNELKQYIRKNKLNLRRDKDRSLAAISAYYDQITRPQ